MIDPDKLIYINSGRNRDVYLLPGGKYVLKVPRNANGIVDNRYEHSIKYSKYVWSATVPCYANCRLIPGTDLLVMEYIRPSSFQEIKNILGEAPIWIDSIDDGQVGFDHKGRLKAYDYGMPFYKYPSYNG